MISQLRSPANQLSAKQSISISRMPDVKPLSLEEPNTVKPTLFMFGIAMIVMAGMSLKAYKAQRDLHENQRHVIGRVYGIDYVSKSSRLYYNYEFKIDGKSYEVISRSSRYMTT